MARFTDPEAVSVYRVVVGKKVYGPYDRLATARAWCTNQNNYRGRYRLDWPEAHIEKADVTWVALEGE